MKFVLILIYYNGPLKQKSQVWVLEALLYRYYKWMSILSTVL